MRGIAATTLLGLLAVASLSESGGKSAAEPRLRRPVALALMDNGKWLFVGNRQSGTISAIDTATLRVTAEVELGGEIADLVAGPDGQYLLAIDEEKGELLVLRRRDGELQLAHRLKVSPSPVGVQVTADGARAIVASLWSAQLTIVDLRPKARVVKTIDLPFAPRQQLPVSERKLAIADAFGGRLAIVDLGRYEVESVRELPAHNIRGLALSGDGKRLLIAHQTLNPIIKTTFDDIHWGNLLTNNVRSIPMTALLDPKADLLRGGDLIHLGGPGHGVGDPAGMAVVGETFVLALAGVDEIAIGREHGAEVQYVSVGRRPTSVQIGSGGRRAFVANTFGDSISVIDLVKRTLVGEIALGTVPELTPAQRGELLFRDARLAHDGWMSCHSCHSDGHTSGRLADTFGDGTFGTPKRILSLLGVGGTGPWAWNGGIADLETQVRQSIEKTMQGKKPTADQARDLTAYLKTLPPPPARMRLRGQVDEAAAERGRALFDTQACGQCHTPPLYTSAKTYDVGLADEAGYNRFNPPSLRGLSQGGPFLHDGRAASLAEVFSRHRHQLKDTLKPQDLNDLVTFLNTL